MKNKKIHAKLYIPFIIILGITIIFPNSSYISAQEKEKSELKTVVIDPGHGGKDPGALGKQTKEKDLVLKLGLKLGKYIEDKMDDVEVVYTRKTDTFVPLFKRAEIANENEADLFISLHFNANKKTHVNGTETYAMGLHKTESNLEVAKKENAAIYYEEDYSEKYEGFEPESAESYIIFSLIQNTHLEQSLNFASFVQDEFKEETTLKNRGVKQAGFLLLWKTTMPSVLIEAGFLSNPEEESYLQKDEVHENLAYSIFKAFKAYKKRIDSKSVSLSKKKDSISYKLQIASSNNPIPKDSDYFKNYDNIKEYKLENKYKYTIGDFKEYDKVVEMKKEIKKDFPGAFVVAFKNKKPISVEKAIRLTEK
ncbi:MAG: N-acetylmuramoyl-L-alanine amidase family protein [Bacteroidota bacterium]